MHRLLRYTLDLFSPAPPAPLTSPSPPTSTLAEPVDANTPPAFCHPQATRQALCEGMPVRYAFVRARRRTIGFQVGPQGLSVRAPLRTPLYVVDAALQEKAAWIVRKLHDVGRRHQAQAPLSISWSDGMELPYLGRTIMLRLDRRQPPIAWPRSGTQREIPCGCRWALMPRQRNYSAPRNAGCRSRRWFCLASVWHISRRTSACAGAACS